MRGLIRGTLSVIGVLLVGGACLSVYKKTRSIPLINKHIIEYDVRFSQHSKNNISNFIEKEPLFKTMQWREQLQALQQHFPHIQSYQCSARPSGQHCITITAPGPISIVNNTIALLDDCRCINSICFDEQYCAILPSVVCTDTMAIGEDSAKTYLRNSLQKIPWNILLDYQCVWHSPTKIVLKSKKNPALAIICGGELMLTSDLLQACEQSAPVTEKQSKQPARLIADIRFRGQIIVRSCKKGGLDEKDIF